MAQRRMFSLKIIDQDEFISMGHGARLLYFDLAIRADDDGFVNGPKKIMRMTNASEDDYKILIAKRFIIPFESGVCVIKDWRVHNYIQNDRYQQTHFVEEKKQLSITENGSYEPLNRMYPECIQNVSILDTQVRLGKDSIEIDKESKDIVQEKAKRFIPPSLFEVTEYMKEIGDCDFTAEYFIAKNEERDWKLKNGKKISSWKATIRTWKSMPKPAWKTKEKESDDYWDEIFENSKRKNQ